MVEPAHLVAVAVVLAVGVAVVSDAVPLTPRTVFATAPWPVAAAGVVVAQRAGVYDGSGLSTALLVVAVGGTAVACWVLFAHLAALRELPYRERYLVASGIGAAVVVTWAVVGNLGDLIWTRLVWLAFAPVLALLLAGCGYFVLGLVYTEALVTFRLAGLYVVWTFVLDGAASAVAVATLGGNESGVVTTGIVAVLAGVGVETSSWLLLPIHTLLGVVFVGCCGWLARQYDPAGYGFGLVASALTLGSASVVLLSATLLG